jgi:hypothetical protein
MRRAGTKHVSRKSADVALSLLLTGCTDERLAGFTAERLVSAYNVKLETAQRKLADARMRRGML